MGTGLLSLAKDLASGGSNLRNEPHYCWKN